MTRSNAPRPRIGLTMGDPAGVGPEIVARAALDPEVRRRCAPLIIGDLESLQRCCARLEALVAAPLHVVERPGEAHGEREGLEVLPIDTREAPPGRVTPGEISARAGWIATRCVERACELGLAGEIAAMATAPIHKEALRLAGVTHIGHTELLAARFGVEDPLTLFVTGPMRIFFLSRHLSLRQAIEHVTQPRLERCIARVHHAMRDLGFDAPRLGVAALNPHASDGGQFGDEEARHITPAVGAMRQRGVDVHGPIGADSIFHMALEGRFDAVLSLYHDQGHIAAKTRDFHGTITATLGLPVLRTSVDHGTAMDIAWQGRADARSMRLAVLAAAEMCGGERIT